MQIPISELFKKTAGSTLSSEYNRVRFKNERSTGNKSAMSMFTRNARNAEDETLTNRHRSWWLSSDWQTRRG